MKKIWIWIGVIFVILIWIIGIYNKIQKKEWFISEDIVEYWYFSRLFSEKWSPSFEGMIAFSGYNKDVHMIGSIKGNLIFYPEIILGSWALHLDKRGPHNTEKLYVSGDFDLERYQDYLYVQPTELTINQGTGHQMNPYWDTMIENMSGKILWIPLAYRLRSQDEIFSSLEQGEVKLSDQNRNEDASVLLLSEVLQRIFSERMYQLIHNEKIAWLVLYVDTKKHQISRDHREKYYSTAGNFQEHWSHRIVTANYNQRNWRFQLEKKSDFIIINLEVKNTQDLEQYYTLDAIVTHNWVKKPLQSLPNRYIPSEQYVDLLDMPF